MSWRSLPAVLATAVAFVPALAAGQSTRLLHQPDVSDRHVAFAYAGDIWIAPRAGGDARRVTSSPTVESDPHFSPDGKWLAFTGQYGGNPDVYVEPVDGGEPRRLTWHPGPDAVRGWTPDGKKVVFVSTRTGVPDGEPKLWTVAVDGGMPEALVVPRAQAGDVSPDGRLVAYQMVRPWENEFRNYRGGQNQPIRVLDLESHSLTKVPWTDSRDQQPVWLGRTVYFISDRDWTNNVWAYDTDTKQLKQITRYPDFEVESVNAGAGAVVYEQAGDIHLYDPASGTDAKLDIRATGDFPWAMPHAEDVGDALTGPQLSPTGVRAVFEARGDIFTVPADKGTWRNLTRSSDVADRSPVWAPDGKRVAWFSDEGGEYRLMVGDQDGTTAPKAYDIPRPSYFYSPAWSPDGKRILFSDAAVTLRYIDLASGEVTDVDQDNYTWPDRDLAPTWSPDSRWIAYQKRLPGSQYHAIFVHSLDDGTSHQVTDGMADAIHPAWDRSGKYLLFLSSTDWALNTGWLDMSSYDRPVRRGITWQSSRRTSPRRSSPSRATSPATPPRRRTAAAPGTAPAQRAAAAVAPEQAPPAPAGMLHRPSASTSTGSRSGSWRWTCRTGIIGGSRRGWPASSTTSSGSRTRESSSTATTSRSGRPRTS